MELWAGCEFVTFWGEVSYGEVVALVALVFGWLQWRSNRFYEWKGKTLQYHADETYYWLKERRKASSSSEINSSSEIKKAEEKLEKAKEETGRTMEITVWTWWGLGKIRDQYLKAMYLYQGLKQEMGEK